MLGQAAGDPHQRRLGGRIGQLARHRPQLLAEVNSTTLSTSAARRLANACTSSRTARVLTAKLASSSAAVSCPRLPPLLRRGCRRARPCRAGPSPPRRRHRLGRARPGRRGSRPPGARPALGPGRRRRDRRAARARVSGPAAFLGQDRLDPAGVGAPGLLPVVGGPGGHEQVGAEAGEAPGHRYPDADPAADPGHQRHPTGQRPRPRPGRGRRSRPAGSRAPARGAGRWW